MTISTLDEIKAPTLLEQTREAMVKTRKLMQARDALNRLRKNKDFKLIFEDLYFRTHLDELVQSLAILSSKDARAGAERSISAIGSLRYYLDCIDNNYAQLEVHLQNLEEQEQMILAGKIDELGNIIDEDTSDVEAQTEVID